MKDFLIAMGPIVGFWMLPLLPLIYTTLVTVVESVFGAVRYGLKAPAKADLSIVKRPRRPEVDSAAVHELSA